MKIKVQEIPEQGKNYSLNRDTAELNEALSDLVKNEPYTVNLFIKPMSTKDYQITGAIQTATYEQCSLCAEDFKWPISRKVSEFLLPYQEEDRKSHYSRTSVDMSESSADVNVTHYRYGVFDMGEYVHEAVALEIPFNPKCPTCSAQSQVELFKYDEKMGEEVKKSPFESLKGIKLN